MSRAIAVRLLAFVLVIGGTFASAYGLGRRLPGNPESKPHTHAAPTSVIPSAFEVDGYVLVTEAGEVPPSTLRLHVTAPDGTRVTQFVEMNGAALDVVIIRPDLSGFHHLRPDVTADGSFVVPLDGPGSWHVVVDAHPAGAAQPIALATNVDDEVAIDPVRIPEQQNEVTVDGIDVRRDGMTFTVAAPERAELFAFHEGDLTYVHTEPSLVSGATVAFDTALAQGINRVFFEFTEAGAVHTAAFTVVAP